VSERDGGRERGSATVWAAVGIAAITTVLVVGLHFGAAVIARHRAEAAADLAALAAAGAAVEGAEAACERAERVVEAMGATLAACHLDGWDALVEAHAPVAIAVPGVDTASGRARAGPVTPTDPGTEPS
jgi:secretion/DNA translocation related TadE-like protein